MRALAFSRGRTIGTITAMIACVALLCGASARADTVNTLRNNWTPNLYVADWLNYMGFQSIATGSPESLDAENAIATIVDAMTPPNTSAMKSALENYLTTNPPDELASGVFYFYFNRLVDMKGAIHDPTEFASLMPAWSLLIGPNTRFMYSYVHIDLAWQSVAENNGTLALAYFQRVRDTAWQLIQEHPSDPIQIWNTYNYMIASAALGEASVAAAIDDLRPLITTYDGTVLAWTARHQIASFSSVYSSIPTEREEHLSAMHAQFDAQFLQDAVNADNVMRDAKAMIELMKGNCLIGMMEFDDAVAQYDAVAANYPNRMEWVPRKTGRTVTNTSEYGVVSMTAFSRTEAKGFVLAKNPDQVMVEYETFLANFPRSEYIDHVLWKLGRHKQHAGDLAQAKTYYEKIVNEHGYSALAGMAQDKLAEVDQLLAAQ